MINGSEEEGRSAGPLPQGSTARPSLGLSIAITLGVLIVPTVAVFSILVFGQPHPRPLLAAGLSVLATAAATVLGALIWRTQPESDSTAFGHLMLWTRLRGDRSATGGGFSARRFGSVAVNATLSTIVIALVLGGTAVVDNGGLPRSFDRFIPGDQGSEDDQVLGTRIGRESSDTDAAEQDETGEVDEDSPDTTVGSAGSETTSTASGSSHLTGGISSSADLGSNGSDPGTDPDPGGEPPPPGPEPSPEPEPEPEPSPEPEPEPQPEPQPEPSPEPEPEPEPEEPRPGNGNGKDKDKGKGGD